MKKIIKDIDSSVWCFLTGQICGIVSMIIISII